MAVILVTAGCTKNADGNGGSHEMLFGKNISITISEGEIVDAVYLQQVLDGDVKKEVPYFDLWNKEELKKMIVYMDKNDYMIVPGKYTINQAWSFEDGKFVLNNGEKREVFKFQKKQ